MTTDHKTQVDEIFYQNIEGGDTLPGHLPIISKKSDKIKGETMFIININLKTRTLYFI